ncbi:unnamed protein product [Amoebophrya sp. A120]|nr:unnamed protein product [Amoebophrya sp. A120]|eukprot:GSA120T00007121001.1
MPEQAEKSSSSSSPGRRYHRRSLTSDVPAAEVEPSGDVFLVSKTEQVDGPPPAVGSASSGRRGTGTNNVFAGVVVVPAYEHHDLLHSSTSSLTEQAAQPEAGDDLLPQEGSASARRSGKPVVPEVGHVEVTVEDVENKNSRDELVLNPVAQDERREPGPVRKNYRDNIKLVSGDFYTTSTLQLQLQPGEDEVDHSFRLRGSGSSIRSSTRTEEDDDPSYKFYDPTSSGAADVEVLLAGFDTHLLQDDGTSSSATPGRTAASSTPAGSKSASAGAASRQSRQFHEQSSMLQQLDSRTAANMVVPHIFNNDHTHYTHTITPSSIAAGPEESTGDDGGGGTVATSNLLEQQQEPLAGNKVNTIGDGRPDHEQHLQLSQVDEVDQQENYENRNYTAGASTAASTTAAARSTADNSTSASTSSFFFPGCCSPSDSRRSNSTGDHQVEQLTNYTSLPSTGAAEGGAAFILPSTSHGRNCSWSDKELTDFFGNEYYKHGVENSSAAILLFFFTIYVAYYFGFYIRRMCSFNEIPEARMNFSNVFLLWGHQCLFATIAIIDGRKASVLQPAEFVFWVKLLQTWAYMTAGGFWFSCCLSIYWDLPSSRRKKKRKIGGTGDDEDGGSLRDSDGRRTSKLFQTSSGEEEEEDEFLPYLGSKAAVDDLERVQIVNKTSTGTSGQHEEHVEDGAGLTSVIKTASAAAAAASASKTSTPSPVEIKQQEDKNPASPKTNSASPGADREPLLRSSTFSPEDELSGLSSFSQDIISALTLDSQSKKERRKSSDKMQRELIFRYVQLVYFGLALVIMIDTTYFDFAEQYLPSIAMLTPLFLSVFVTGLYLKRENQLHVTGTLLHHAGRATRLDSSQVSKKSQSVEALLEDRERQAMHNLIIGPETTPADAAEDVAGGAFRGRTSSQDSSPQESLLSDTDYDENPAAGAHDHLMPRSHVSSAEQDLRDATAECEKTASDLLALQRRTSADLADAAKAMDKTVDELVRHSNRRVSALRVHLQKKFTHFTAKFTEHHYSPTGNFMIYAMGSLIVFFSYGASKWVHSYCGPDFCKHPENCVIAFLLPHFNHTAICTFWIGVGIWLQCVGMSGLCAHIEAESFGRKLHRQMEVGTGQVVAESHAVLGRHQY